VIREPNGEHRNDEKAQMGKKGGVGSFGRIFGLRQAMRVQSVHIELFVTILLKGKKSFGWKECSTGQLAQFLEKALNKGGGKPGSRPAQHNG